MKGSAGGPPAKQRTEASHAGRLFFAMQFGNAPYPNLPYLLRNSRDRKCFPVQSPRTGRSSKLAEDRSGEMVQSGSAHPVEPRADLCLSSRRLSALLRTSAAQAVSVLPGEGCLIYLPG